ncbi:MAG: hypothetical protein ACRC6V_04065 [Bacteroidales bacterium]
MSIATLSIYFRSSTNRKSIFGIRPEEFLIIRPVSCTQNTEANTEGVLDIEIVFGRSVRTQQHFSWATPAG